ncbi:MAG: hypothetical protein QOF79_2283 [Actinomycetota bacterium]|nr:hypothetical protein [Actinomycetota bacterium]
MKHSIFLGTAFVAVAALALSFAGGTGTASGVDTSSVGSTTFAFSAPKSVVLAGAVVSPEASSTKSVKDVSPDGEHVAQTSTPTPGSRAGGSATAAAPRRTQLASKAKACPSNVSGSTNSAPSAVSKGGVLGTTSADLSAFAQAMNDIRVAHCLAPIPLANYKYDSCMEQRLFWMAEDPSTNPSSAWGHIGSKRSDGVPSVGCDGNLAGGSGNTGATVAQKWWDSTEHRAVEYRPTFTGNIAGVCILFAMTHGGIPNEPTSFTRAASRWVTC